MRRKEVIGVNGEEIQMLTFRPIGEYAKSLEIDYYYSIGKEPQVLCYGFTHMSDAKSLVQQLKRHKDATILFKASRSAKLERVIEQLRQ